MVLVDGAQVEVGAPGVDAAFPFTVAEDLQLGNVAKHVRHEMLVPDADTRFAELLAVDLEL